MFFTTDVPNPPQCFGKSYDNADPRCIACSFQHSCRQVIVKTGVMMSGYYPQYAPPVATQPPQSFYTPPAPAPATFIPSPPPPPAQYIQTQPAQYRPPPWTPPAQSPSYRVPVQTAPTPVMAPQAQPPMIPTQPGMVAPWAPVHFQIPASLPPSKLGYYGYYPDQMWGAVAAVAPVWRPQQPGETFGTRAVKNMILVLLEHMFQQLMLATRQAFFPPIPESASQTTVDVTPRS